MKNKFNIFIITLVAIFSIGVGTQSFSQAPVNQAVNQTVYTTVNALDIVSNPSKYLNKHIKIKGSFDKFSTLGLDYAPAMRSSEKYITFLIQRDDVKDYDIPLSELKIFMNRTEAEKHINLSPGDEIEFCGKVFSNALGDVWIDVEKFTVISQKNKETK